MAGTLSDVYAVSEAKNFTVVTRDATPVTVAEINLSWLEGGQATLEVVGIDQSGNMISGRKYVRYKKDATGAIVASAVANEQGPVVDTALTGASFGFGTANGNAFVTVTGVAGKNIGWEICLKRQAVSMASF